MRDENEVLETPLSLQRLIMGHYLSARRKLPTDLDRMSVLLNEVGHVSAMWSI